MRKTPIRKPWNDRAMTLADIAAELGTSTERVRQIEKRALEKFAAKCKRMGLKPEYILPATYDEAKA